MYTDVDFRVICVILLIDKHYQGNTMINKSKWLKTAQELYGIQLRRKFYEEEESRLKKELEELSDGKSCEFDEWTFDRIERKGSIAYSSIPFLKSMDLEEYRKPGSVAWLLKKKVTADDIL